MSQSYKLSSSQLLIDINAPFRVFAGPGAGKTYWLVEHVKNVIARSYRLNGVSRVACISFTNVAVDEIQKGLDSEVDGAEASTIHSFLYRNVVKPYLHLVTDLDNGLPLFEYTSVDGHDEHVLNWQFVTAWLKSLKFQNSGQRYFYTNKDGRKLIEACLRKIEWKWDGPESDWRLDSGAWQFETVLKSINKVLKAGLYDYKRQYWRAGKLDHDDVLRFSHFILTEYPVLLRHLASRFPYLFVDEFQDTHPLQAELVTWLASAGVTVGVIGDAEQALFGFNGADPRRFMEFDIPGVVDYMMEGNRRSTIQIVSLLNQIRTDEIEQPSLRRNEGEQVEVIVGSLENSLAQAREHAVVPPHFLAWTNDTVRIARAVHLAAGHEAWEEFETVFSDRARFFKGLAQALSLVEGLRLAEAVRILVKAIRVRNGEIKNPLKSLEAVGDIRRRGLAVAILVHLRSEGTFYKDLTLLEAYERLNVFLRDELCGYSLVSVKSGKFKTFSENVLFGDLLQSVDHEEPTAEIRTVHKSKGAEFDTVMLRLEEPNWISCLTRLEAVEDEIRRVIYVGLSRAQERLFVSVDTLSGSHETILKSLDVRVTRLDETGHVVDSGS